MEFITSLIADHAAHAHWIIFFSFILSGFNIPISEDLLIITGALLASNVIPENALKIFLFIFMGAYISDNMVYWIGRLLGPGLSKWKWFSKAFSKKRLEKAQNFFIKRGILALFIGRLIPFGIRNCLFITAGMSKMPFGKFMLGDGFACMFSNAVLFSFSFFLGKNIQQFFNQFKFIIFIAFILLMLIFWYSKKRIKKANMKVIEKKLRDK